MFYDPRHEPHGLPHDPFLSLVAPRPIGWISTRARDGVANLSPYSFFNAFSTRPYVVGFSGTARKDSVRNAEETGAFVVNVASFSLRDAMNASSVAVPPHVDEFAVAGLTAAPSRLVAAPRVAEALAALECVTVQVVGIRGAAGGEPAAHLVLGEVVGIHIDESILSDGLVDTARLKPLARLGYMNYAVVESVFDMARPKPPA
ncbi:flavin reductase family protein [Chthonobacter rhizosphaerae]|uniref:flavin reductase family protein n=1 Tax=Chthonobacter rhizosphaerae TaxID=2735553 RepID=UPI0015EF60E6|nr:flavin reductase family protein [Chthonobacter rhizosphaerae]